MKYLLTLCFVAALLSTGFSQTKISSTGMKKVNAASLSEQTAQKISKSKLPPSLKLSGTKIMPAEGYVLYGKDNVFVVWNLADFKKADGNNDGKISTYFDIVIPGQPIAGGIGMYFLYCSCGNNIMDSSGDNCHWYPQDGALVCLGNCQEGNQGSTCSFTGLQVFNDGRVSILPL